MNAPVKFDEAKPASLAEPTREQRMRFIDLSFECAREAARQMPSGRILGDEDRLPPRNYAREALIERLRLEAMEREGLPLSLLPDRAPLSSFADLDEGARHPLAPVRSTWGMGGVS